MANQMVIKLNELSAARVSRMTVTTVLVTLLVFSLWSLVAPAQESTRPKRVVVLYWYDKDYPWNVLFDQSFQAALHATGSVPIEYYSEYLETNRFPVERTSDLLHDYLRQKYSDRQIDAVVATSDVPLDFLTKYHSDIFPTAPIIFVATKRPPTDSLAEEPGMTGIISINAYKKTLDLALKLHPDTQQVFIITGTLEHDKRIENLARAELQEYESKLRINYLTDILPNELVAKTNDLPKQSLILYVWQQAQSPEGRTIESMETLGAIAQSAKVPIYRLSTTSYVGGGVVGGYINTAEANGSKVGEIVRQIVNGTAARNIPIESAPTVPEFDWRELQRLGINESDLPGGSIIHFKEITFWDQYKGRIVIVLAIIALQSVLITGLLLERSREKRAIRKLTESEQRFAKAFKANPQPMSLTTLDGGKYVDVNESFLRMSGYTRDEVIGHTSEELKVFSNPAVRDIQLVEPLLRAGVVQNFDFKFRTKNGTFRTLLSSAELLELGGEKCILVASSDITDRKTLEGELMHLTAQLFRLQDEERRRIARELHDGTAQNLFAISVNLAKVSQLDQTQKEEMQRLIAECISLGDESLQEIRTLSYLLHPPLLDQAGLVSALQWYAQGFSKRSGIYVDVFAEPMDRLPADFELALFRVVQESLTNVLRHSGSGSASIRLERRSDEVFLQVRDKGRGLTGNKDGDSKDAEDLIQMGVGIPGMQQRLRQLGGRLEIDSNSEGTTITAVVPMANGAHHVANPARGRS
jgi:PAS domain S-box-containing protein